MDLVSLPLYPVQTQPAGQLTVGNTGMARSSLHCSEHVHVWNQDFYCKKKMAMKTEAKVSQSKMYETNVRPKARGKQSLGQLKYIKH